MKKLYFIALIGFLTIIYGNTYSQIFSGFNSGIEKARKENKNIVVFIYSEGDPWSLKMESVYSMEKIKNTLNSNFIVIRLNAQGTEKCIYDNKILKESELAQLFGVTGYPTHVFLDSSGKIIKFKYNGEENINFPGFIDEKDFEIILNYFLSGKYKDTDLSKVF